MQNNLNLFTFFFQGMYGLPAGLNLRFRLYLQILPIGQTCLMYASFILGTIILLLSIRKFVAARRDRFTTSSPWIQDDLVLNIDRKLSSYIPEKRSSITSKELEVYYNSLIAPINQTLDGEEA